MNIKLEVLVVIYHPYNTNILKHNLNNKRGEKFVDKFVLYIITNNFLAIFTFTPNCTSLIIFVTPNTYETHTKTLHKY